MSETPRRARDHESPDLNTLLLENSDLESIVGLTVKQAVEAVPGARGGGLSLIVGQRVETAAPTNEVVREVDELQYSNNEGPCLFAIRDGHSYRTEDLATDSRFPAFGPAAAGNGIHSSLSLPLQIEDKSIGALNLYAYDEKSFDDKAEEIGEQFAHRAAAVLANAESYFALSELADHLKEALESRDVIGTAKGIIMERENVSNDDAFSMLVKISQTTNIKLREVAAQLVESTTKA